MLTDDSFWDFEKRDGKASPFSGLGVPGFRDEGLRVYGLGFRGLGVQGLGFFKTRGALDWFRFFWGDQGFGV